jgi:catechol 2,3-dioxygenase-like lactoylglutathione lyase family enzyme
VRPRVISSTPVLQVSDLQRSLDFYLKQMGFGEPAVHGEPPCFAMMHRDGFELMLSVGKAHPNTDGLFDVYLRVMDVAGEMAALRASGVEIVRGPCDMFYEMREIDVLDPDGYRWCLGQDTSEAPAQAWEATLDTGAAKLRLVLKVRCEEAVIDSIDQEVMGIPAKNVVIDAGALRFEAPTIGASYTGTRTDDAVEGTWSQRGRAWPLAWRKG